MNEALRDAYLAEMWPVCREVPRGERIAKVKADRQEQWIMEQRTRTRLARGAA